MKRTPCKSDGIAVARLIYQGDIHAARLIANLRSPIVSQRSWTPVELRAMLGAGQSLARFGVKDGVEIAKSIIGF